MLGNSTPSHFLSAKLKDDLTLADYNIQKIDSPHGPAIGGRRFGPGPETGVLRWNGHYGNNELIGWGLAWQDVRNHCGNAVTGLRVNIEHEFPAYLTQLENVGL
jgi:hypothetical protein